MTNARILPILAILGCTSDFHPPASGDLSNELGRAHAGTDGGVGAELPSCAPVPADASTPVAQSCDLSGRWIMSELGTRMAYGATFSTVGWHYVEIEQHGEQLTMKNALFCGEQSVPPRPTSLIVQNVDDSTAWPAYQARSNYSGRGGVAHSQGASCEVSFDRAALVSGMTTPFYADETVALPKIDQMATAGTPGWEDWDNDGQPGVTVKLSGAAAADAWVAFRTFSSTLGLVTPGATSFTLTLDWKRQTEFYGSNVSEPFVTQIVPEILNGERVADDAQNFVELARLSADQAVGDDQAKCAAIRELAPVLNPAANPATPK